MRKLMAGTLGLLMMFGLLSTSGSANVVSGGGYSSSYAGESVFTNVPAGTTGQMSAIFFNDGTQGWAPGVVGLLVCAADKVTCNVSANPAYNSGWYSPTVYATVSTVVSPGQNGFFIYDFSVPQGTGIGTVTTFNGDVGLIASGAELRPEGYFQQNTVPAPTLSLSLSPASASVAVGATQQFTLSGAPSGSTVNWSVLGGCGAVTSAGLFAATSMNSASQPCTVLVSVNGNTTSAPVTVYGSPTSLVCTANPTTLVANGGVAPSGVATVTIALKDVNGNTVANAGTPVITVSNSTPGLATVNPSGPVSPISGVVTTQVSTTTNAGLMEVSASAPNLPGCFVFITSTQAGPGVQTAATFLANPIAADGVSTSTLRVEVRDAAGNRSLGDSTTVITATSGTPGICTIGGGGQAIGTVNNGRVDFVVTSTTTPGNCPVTVSTNNSAITGTQATLVTQIVGSANRVAVASNDSPHAVSNTGTCTVAGSTTNSNTNLSCTIIVAEIQDGNGSRLTSDTGRSVSAVPDPATCSGSLGGNVTLADSTTTSAGRATFAFTSGGNYSGCTITLASAGLSSVNTVAVWTAGGADHLGCTFSPNPIVADNAAQSTGAVTVRDRLNNTVSSGAYSVTFTRTSGAVTVLLTASPVTTANGVANFIVRSTTTAGTDTYSPALSSGSSASLPGVNTTCVIQAQ